MFGFGKKKKQKKEEESGGQKKKSRTDKLVMGAIMGVAVGSVVGMSLKGKNEHKQQEEPELLPAQKEEPQPTEPRSRIGRFLKKLFGKKKKKEPVQKGTFKKIPNEWE